MSKLTVLAVAALVSVPTLAHAQAAVTIMKGSGASAEFAFTTPDNCRTTSVTVIANDDTTIEVGTSRTRLKAAVVSIFQDDVCDASPFPLQNSTGTIENVDLTIDRSLGQARLRGQGLIFDQRNGINRQISLDLAWRASGPPRITANRERIDLGDSTLIVGTVEARRQAQAWGSVSEGGVNYTPVPAANQDTHIERILSGRITLQQ